MMPEITKWIEEWVLDDYDAYTGGPDAPDEWLSMMDEEDA